MRFQLLFLALASGVFAQSSHHYAVILQDPPVAEQFGSKERVRSTGAVTYRRQLQNRQAQVCALLSSRRVGVIGTTDTVLNAVFVTTTPQQARELSGMPGVQGVVELRNARRYTNKATQLVNAPAAWTTLGGTDAAGAGVKIAILDTGIEQTHPAFQDKSLTVPSGFPKCSGFDGPCSAFTNNKVIVARSYVKQLANGSDPANPAADSRPDDYTPRDRDGHGTAVASIAAAVPNGQTITFNGVAPKAFLGSYKVFGSPGVNDSPPGERLHPGHRRCGEGRHGHRQRVRRFRGAIRSPGYGRRLRTAGRHSLRSGRNGLRKRCQSGADDRCGRR